jgi:glycosyltransferase involved in cell wall biosynthesis
VQRTIGQAANVVYVWNHEYPWDVRVEKVCAALTNAGRSVHLTARNLGRRSWREELPEATVHRLRPLPLGRYADAALQFPFFFNPRWVSHLTRTAREANADVLMVRDLPLAPTAIHVGRRLGIPVMLDMAENYPALMTEIFTAKRQKPLDYVVRNPAATAAVERYTLRNIDHVVCVVDEMADRLRTMGLGADRISVVSNTPPRSRVVPAESRTAREPDGALVLGYLGILEIPRGLGDAIDTVARLRSQGIDARLRIIGGGRDSEVFEQHAKRLNLDASIVQFLGRVDDHREAVRALEQTDIGILPYHTSEQWHTTIANKLFDYMALGLPVVAADARPVERILHETGAGVTYRSRDVHDFAHAVLSLRNEDRRRTAGEAGRRAIRDRYHWERDVERLVTAVDITVERARENSRKIPSAISLLEA